MILQIFSNRYHNYTHLMNGTTNTLQEAFCNIILLKPALFLSIFKATRSLPNNFLMPNLFQLIRYAFTKHKNMFQSNRSGDQMDQFASFDQMHQWSLRHNIIAMQI